MARLNRLLQPKSIAVIGGGVWCENVIRECQHFGFTGDLWAVHPKRDNVARCNTFRTLADLPRTPDAAFIGVNRDATVGIVKDLVATGAGGAVCFASGFSEASEELEGAADLQDALVRAAGDMPILGPNCYGLVNALDSAVLWPDQHGLVPIEAGVAIISQSSNIALNLTMQQRGLPIAFLLTVGNQAQTGLSQIAEALLDDDRVTAIGLHIEGIDDLEAFESFARRAREIGKPVTVLKVGKSAQAQATAISHTASLAGSMAGATALFRRLGIAQVSSLPVMIETLKIQHVTGYLPSARIASMSCSGGEASLIADEAEDGRVTFPTLTEVQTTALRDILGPKVALANPLDYHTYIWGDVDAMADTFATMVSGDIALGVVILDLPRADRCQPDDWFPALTAVKRATEISGKPFAILSSLTEGMPETVAQDLIQSGVIPLCSLSDGIDAISAAATPQIGLPSDPLYQPRHIAAPRTLGEDDAKARLAQFGLSLPKSQTAHGIDAAVEAAHAIGFPVVLKAVGVSHKTEAGAVALDLNSSDEVRQVADRMPFDRFLVEQMVTGTTAELLVGIVQDPAHGMVLTLAPGGILTELMHDSASLILPVGRDQIHAALRKLRYASVLEGYRGAEPCDFEAIIDAVMVLQDYALSQPVTEVEVNPLLCSKDFAIAADALIKCGEYNDG